MKFTLNWLKQFLDTNASLEKITKALTALGLEVEEVIDNSALYAPFIIAEITQISAHPNADKLQICSVNYGAKENLQVVCGAKNVKLGMKVVLAPIGAKIPASGFIIQNSKIRDIASSGMLCSEQELLLAKESVGIMELNADAPIGENFADYYGLNDQVIDIAITPNRGDCLGVYGIARDLAAAKIGTLKTLEIPELKPSFKTDFQVKIDSSQDSELFIAYEIRNVKNQPSPKWLAHYLKAIGIEPISALVDITNYINYSFARPLHAYDKSKLGNHLKITKANDGYNFQALSGQEYKLTNQDIVVDDENKIHALGGIIGGMDSSCTLETTDIILESALFNPITVSNTGRRLQIDTDSRYRFERNVDPESTIYGAQLAASLIQKICGGEISQMLETGQYKTLKRSIAITAEQINLRLGTDLSLNQMKQILGDLGFEITKTTENLEVIIPSWRSDISISEDISEEIARIYGYDNLPVKELPQVSNINTRVLNQSQAKKSSLKRILAARGFDEVVSWSFMDENLAKLFAPLNDNLRIQNPISSDLNYMRPTIIANLLTITAKNQARSIHNLALFEVGPTFSDTSLSGEHSFCAGIITELKIDKNIHEKTRKVDIYDAKTTLSEIFAELGLGFAQMRLEPANTPQYYHPGRSAQIKLGKNILGSFGEIHPNIIKIFDLKGPVVAFEINLDNLPVTKHKFGRKPKFTSSNYQPVQRDFAFLIDKNQNVGEIQEFIKNLDRNLIQQVKLYDVYHGENIEPNKKSVALNVLLQSSTHTLTDEELKNMSDLIIKQTQTKYNASLRE